MKKINLIVFTLLCLGIRATNAQYTILHNFNDTLGFNPEGNVTISGGKMYGMTNEGGAHNFGCIFSADTNGNNYKDILDFNGPDGENPWGSLIVIGQKLYGMTQNGGGGDGCIFSIDTNGTGYTLLKSFTGVNGSSPFGSLTSLGPKLFGMTWMGGVNYEGNVFSIDTNGNGYKSLYSFNTTYGEVPHGDVIILNNKLYGMTGQGGAHGEGVIFRLDTNGTGYKDLHDFTSLTGMEPTGDLTLVGNKFFGMAGYGGAHSDGVIFSIDTNGNAYTDLLDFTSINGKTPQGGLTLWGTVLYGMTSEGGLHDWGDIISIDTNGTGFTDLLDFDNTIYPTGGYPYASLTLFNDQFYGMTSGGSIYYDGVIFRYKPPCFLGSISMVSTNVLCHGGSNGTAMASPSGGVLPYTYSWSGGGGTNATASGLSAGTYIVSVIDNNGCTGSASVTITQPNALSVSANATPNVLCSGGTTGGASSTITGGTSPYTYSWSNSQTTQNITGLTAGTYTLSVNDSCGASATASVNITQPNVLSVSASVTANVLCSGGSTGSASSSVSGGTSPYTYLWSDSQTTTNISSLSAGTYTLNVTDKNGCTGSATVSITQPPALTVSTSSTNVTCYSASDGSASSAVSGGSSPYTYFWSNGGTNASESGLSAGTYTITVHDICGGSATASVMVSGPTTVLHFSYEQAVQNWAVPTGITQVTITVAGAAGGDDYDIVYSQLMGIEGKGATLTGICTVTPGDNLSVVIGSIGGNGFSNGPPHYSAGGGGGSFVFDSNTSNLLIVGAGGGGSCGVADSGGRGGINILTMATTNGTQSTAIGGTGGNGGTVGYGGAGGAGWISNGDSITSIPCYGGGDRANFFMGGYGANSNSGGYGGGGGGGINGGGGGGGYNGGGGGGATIASLGGGGGGGSYLNGTLSGSVLANSTGNGYVTISYTNLPLSITMASEANILCHGGTGSATANIATGGVPNYSYSWTPSGGSNLTASGLSAGTYTITVTDANGCIATASATITQPNSLNDSTKTIQSGICVCKKTLIVFPYGGTQPYTYLWSNSVTKDTNYNVPTGATYSVTITDSNGCTRIDSIVLPSQTFTLTTTQTNIFPCYEDGDGIASAIASPALSGYQYSWAPGGQTTASISGLSVGSYTVTVIDSVPSCKQIAIVTITQPSQLLVSATLISNITCNGGNNGSAFSNASGGILPYTYHWSDGETSPTASALSAGTAIVMITDANGCTATASVTITQPLPFSVTIPALSPNCLGNYFPTAVVTGGTRPYSYSWSPPSGPNDSSVNYFPRCIPFPNNSLQVVVTDAHGCTAGAIQYFYAPPTIDGYSQTNVSCGGGNNGSIAVNICEGSYFPDTYNYTITPGGTFPSTNPFYTFTNLSAGTYSITVYDTYGCNSNNPITVTITQPPALVVSANTTAEVLCHAGTNGSASSSANGGTTPYTYLWSNSQTTTSISNLSAGTYTLNVTDNNGCTGSATVSITQPSALSVSATVTANVSCHGGTNGSASSTVSGGTIPYTYFWSNSQTTPNISSLSAGTYTLIVTDNNGCTGSAIVSITQPTALNVSANTTAEVLCRGETNGSASSTISGGTTPYTYLWSNSQTTPNISSLSAGIYTLNVTDNNGCTGSATVSITQPLTLTATIGTVTNVACNGGTGNLTVIAGGGTIPFNYTWSPTGGTGATATGLTSGCYTVTVTDNNGCTATATNCITQPNMLIVSANATKNVNCNGGTNGSASSTVSGGTTPYTYLWSNSQTTPNLSSLSAGTYTLNVTDKNGCRGSASIAITQPDVLSISANITADVLCNGEKDGSASSTVSGGTPAYTYSWSGGGGTNANASNLSAGTYTVTITDSCGGSATAAVTITQPPVLTVTIYSADDTGSNSGAAWVHVTGGDEPYTYLWEPGGQTTDSITGLSGGRDTCTIIDNNGCKVKIEVVVNNTTGVSNIINTAGQINIYPNPNNGLFTIALQNVNEPCQVEIYNVLGENIHRAKLNSTNTEINLNGEPQGVYLYRVISENGNLFGEGKIVVQK